LSQKALLFEYAIDPPYVRDVGVTSISRTDKLIFGAPFTCGLNSWWKQPPHTHVNCPSHDIDISVIDPVIALIGRPFLGAALGILRYVAFGDFSVRCTRLPPFCVIEVLEKMDAAPISKSLFVGCACLKQVQQDVSKPFLGRDYPVLLTAKIFESGTMAVLAA
jgi:hypothetical protein